jgi:hypothetical protein
VGRRVELLLHALERLVRIRQPRHAELATSGSLGRGAPMPMHQLVPGDPQQPGARRRLAGPIAPARQERRGEHLGGDVERLLGREAPPAQLAEHRPHVAVVELAERPSVVRGPREQLVVG